MCDTQPGNPQDPLSSFTPPVREWFGATFGEPTPPQAQSWPAIQRGDHALILAPTGSGKTLAAFLWGIDELLRELTDQQQADEAANDIPGVRLVYVSPLKALNNDIRRNLRAPLAGIRKTAREMAIPFPEIRVAVRSGDTPQRERQAMVRTPPHILITTPESLYLLLTSPKARRMFRTVRTVIVDEIHTLAGNKRGVHLSISLERLQDLADGRIQRIGLSATIQPLDEVARFLGGAEWQEGPATRDEGPKTKDEGPKTEAGSLVPRPVTIVDAHYRKPLDLKVVTVVDDFRDLPGGSVWPSVIARVHEQIRQHRTTLIFCNNRRLAERTADRLNEQIAAEERGETLGLIEGGVVRGIGFMAAGAGTHPGPIRAHHGSISREARLQMERDLKEGKLSALVATSSLELGIDIGSVDLVIQLGAPKSVAQGLQRVGRSGHLVGQTSKGRIFPTHREEVMEAAAVAGGVLRGEVEPTYTPRNPLDVLAQQIVAMVSVETWDANALYNLVRQAYAYHELSPQAYRTVLEMLAGKYPSQAHRELRARIAWDRVNNRLAALPGSRMLALTNGGTIPDRGTFGAYLSDGKTKLGELDEEFVYETRLGDTFMLGSQVWRVTEISDDRVLVTEAPGVIPRMPFWRGDYPWRPYELGKKIAEFRRAVVEKLRELMELWGTPGNYRSQSANWESPSQFAPRHSQFHPVVEWLQQDYALDENSAWHVVDYVAGQLDAVGAISSDRTVVVELFEDALGEPRMVVHSPFGGRVNGPWGLALAGALRERTGVEVEVQTNDDGILLRFPNADAEFPLDLVAGIGPAEVRERVLQELPNSAVFGAQFRQNAARALLLPGMRPGKRTPFWLQRLRAKDLLQVVRGFDDFPILLETYRDCLQDVMDLPHLEEVLQGIQTGDIQVVTVESFTPSPVAQGLLMQFAAVYVYEWDTPKAERQFQQLTLNRALLQDLLKDVALDELLKPEAIAQVTYRLQHTMPTARARTAEELALLLQQMGDLSTAEIAERTATDPTGWIEQLAGENRIVELSIPTAQGLERRWVAAEYVAEYVVGLGGLTPAPPSPLPLSRSRERGRGAQGGGGEGPARRQILQRFLQHAGPVTMDDIRARYAFPEEWLRQELEHLVEAGELAHGRFTSAVPSPDQYLDRRNLEQAHRHTLTLLRREVQPVPRAVYADFLALWQHLEPSRRLGGRGALTQVLQQLRALPVAGQVWERDVLSLRLEHYDPAGLEALCQSGEVVWIGSGGSEPRRARVRFLFRGEGHVYLEPAPQSLASLSSEARTVYEFLRSEGAVFFADIRAALDLQDEALERALVELVMGGLVTNDSLEAMRQLTRLGSTGLRDRSAEDKARSSLEAQLAGWRAQRASEGVRRPDLAAYRAAKRRVAGRLRKPELPYWMGRWSPVHRFGVMGKEVPPEERAARQARQLLQRWGVVTRESLAAEEGAWDWGLIYAQLRLMEMRGEVRRGYFVEGLPGIQFASPEAVEQLRARRDVGVEADDAPVVLNACDPANLYGPEVEGGPLTAAGTPLTFARLPSTWLVQWRGHPVLIAEGAGTSITTGQGMGEGLIRRALQVLFDHLAGFERRVTVETWDGEPVLGSAGQSLLESLGCYRDYPGMTWEKVYWPVAG